MLTERLIDAGIGFLNAILNFLDVLPDIPARVIEVMNTYLNTIFEYGWNGACFFLPMDYALILLPLVIVVLNFEHAYHLIMWVLRKIPVLGIE